MEFQELAATALRAVGIYLLMLFVVRLLGKRTVGNFSAMDLLVALMLGEVVDEVIYGDVRFMQGTVAIVVLAAVAYGDSLLSYWDHGMEAVLEGRPTVLVKEGDFQRASMRSERMNEKDVMSSLRKEGIQDMREVKLATLEQDGTVSVLKYDWADAAKKADVDRAAAKQRDERLGGVEEPPLSKQTDSKKALSQEA